MYFKKVIMMRSGAIANFVHSDPLTISVLKSEWDAVKRCVSRENLMLIADELQKKFEPIDSLLSAYFDIASSGFVTKAKYSSDLEQALLNIDRLIKFVDDFIDWSSKGIQVVEENLRNLGIRNWMMVGQRISHDAL